MADARRLLATLTVAWAVVWLQRAALSPAGPELQAELGIGYGALGLLSTVSVVAGAAGYLAAGFLASARPRACLVGGAALVAVATLAAWAADSYAALAASQALAGFGEGLFYVPALALVTHAFPPERSGRALGILDTGISAGSFLVLLAAGPLLPLGGWRGLFLGAGLVGAGVLVLLALMAKPEPRQAAGGIAHVLHRRALPLYVAVTLLLVVYFALLYMSPALLVARGLTVGDAALVTAIAVGLGIPWHVAGGILADRHGAARSGVAFALVFALALVALALASEGWALPLLLILAYGIGIGAFIAVITLVPRVLGADLAAQGFGVFWAVGYGGGALGPVALGALADAVGFTPALLALAVLAALAALVLRPLARA